MIVKFGPLYVIMCIANDLVAELSEGRREGPIIGYTLTEKANQRVWIT
jgi:hypothetical protein